MPPTPFASGASTTRTSPPATPCAHTAPPLLAVVDFDVVRAVCAGSCNHTRVVPVSTATATSQIYTHAHPPAPHDALPTRAVHATHALRVGSLHHAHQLATHARLLLAVVVVDVVSAVCAGACDHTRVVPASPAIPSFHLRALAQQPVAANTHDARAVDRKSTRLNSSH